MRIRPVGDCLFEKLNGLVVPGTRFFPIDDLEEGVDEVTAGRAVVVVVRVLPDVQREDGVGAPERALIVLVDGDVPELVAEGVVDEERPATGSGRGGLELTLPGLVGTEVLLDPVGEIAGGFVAALGTHRLPEQVVEDMAGAVVGDVAQRRGRRGEVPFLAILHERLFGTIPAVDVALMVGIVMPREDLFADVRFECVVVVGQRRQFVVCHSYLQYRPRAREI